MLFNSAHFLVFLPVVTLLYFVVPRRWQWALLLVASYYFYMSWRPEYLLLILLSTVTDYLAGVQMGRKGTRNERRPYLLLSLLVNLGLLFTFKYFNFFRDSLDTVYSFLRVDLQLPILELLLPVGISFYTFQTLSYSIDVYRGVLKPEKHFGRFALYVAFFPQLVAGPIERATRLLPQFRQTYIFDETRLVSGLQLILWGFFKKVVVADRLAIIVNKVYSAPQDYKTIDLVIATYFFAYQIFCDFSGYSDIAIGVARILGIDLMKNFERPYHAASIREFWRRWHISLSTWFRDYLYIPLGGNRVSQGRLIFNLVTVFVISGLWHGANWTFVIWGALHGFYLVAELFLTKSWKRLTSKSKKAYFSTVGKYISIFITFHLVTFAWIFFRANSVSDAFYLVSRLPHFTLSDPVLPTQELYLPIFVILCVEFIHIVQGKFEFNQFLDRSPLVLRWGLYYFLFFASIYLGVFTDQEFIYFQF